MLIFYMSTQTGLPGPWWKSYVGHVVEYSVLSGLFWFALTRTTELKNNTIIVIALLLATAYGFSDEWHQSLVPGRTPEVQDLIIDFIAASMGAILAHSFFNKRVN